ncbi:hypothetical protein [Paenibacillus chitinolyticus]|uniref:hypothetical protein n=1 Tax=Paenibacillus chitinolyticus TaxID=79263 RepID=UPI003D054D36
MNDLKFTRSVRTAVRTVKMIVKKGARRLNGRLFMFVPHGIYAGRMKRRMTIVNRKLLGMRIRDAANFSHVYGLRFCGYFA